MTERTQASQWLTRAQGLFALRLIALTAGGMLLGLLVWHHNRPGLLLLLSVGWQRATAGLGAFALMAGYYLAGAQEAPLAVTRFFPAATAGFGPLLWVAQAVVLALPYGGLYRFGTTGLMLALLLTALPPLGVIGWLSPLLAAGVWFPATAVPGLVAMLLLFACAASPPAAMLRRWRRCAALLAVSAWAQTPLHAVSPSLPPGWVALDTHAGRYPRDAMAVLLREARLEQRVRGALRSGATLVLLPESAAGVWTPWVADSWRQTVDQARRQGAVLLLGAEMPRGDGGWADALLVRGALRGTLDARVPIPFGMWRPWDKISCRANWFGSGLVILQGHELAVSFCYEDTLMFPLLWSFLRGRPQAILSLADDWFAQGMSEPAMQRNALFAQAQLYGVPVLRALNAPMP